MADVLEKPTGGWLALFVKVAIALFVINFAFDLLNVILGKNLKAFFNRPISLFYPGKSYHGGGISPPAQPVATSTGS